MINRKIFCKSDLQDICKALYSVLDAQLYRRMVHGGMEHIIYTSISPENMSKLQIFCAS